MTDPRDYPLNTVRTLTLTTGQQVTAIRVPGCWKHVPAGTVILLDEIAAVTVPGSPTPEWVRS